MSSNGVPSLHEFLAAKTETQLRNYLFKMESGAARLCQHNILLWVFISKEICVPAADPNLDPHQVERAQGRPRPASCASLPGPEWGEAIGGSPQKFILILKLFTFL